MNPAVVDCYFEYLNLFLLALGKEIGAIDSLSIANETSMICNVYFADLQDTCIL